MSAPRQHSPFPAGDDSRVCFEAVCELFLRSAGEASLIRCSDALLRIVDTDCRLLSRQAFVESFGRACDQAAHINSRQNQEWSVLARAARLNPLLKSCEQPASSFWVQSRWQQYTSASTMPDLWHTFPVASSRFGFGSFQLAIFHPRCVFDRSFVQFVDQTEGHTAVPLI